MENNPYIVLMLSEGASEEEVNEAYQRLKKQYSEDRFLEGEDGYVAAKKLTELEQAYSDIQDVLREKRAQETFGSIYGEIEADIKAGSLDVAQNKLDNIAERTAEWHYLQSILFYRKNWHLESKKQLEIAVEMDPGNAKYREALTKLNNVMNSKKDAVPPPQGYGNAQQTMTQGQLDDQQRQMDSQMGAASNCCCSLCLADTCCECMGGDLISCC